MLKPLEKGRAFEIDPPLRRGRGARHGALQHARVAREVARRASARSSRVIRAPAPDGNGIDAQRHAICQALLRARPPCRRASGAPLAEPPTPRCKLGGDDGDP